MSALRGDVDAIRAFLATSLGDDIHLAAMRPDGPLPCGRWFGADAAAAAAWADERNAAGENVYWTVNRVRPGLHKKASKADVLEARFAHVDVDPPKDGGAWDKAAALARLTDGRCAPSFVIDSGGGLQGLWRLDEPSINLDAIETINVGIRDELGADPCQNIDRLMRLPGTVNWPDARKKARGRAPAMAALLVEDDGACHAPQALAAAYPFRSPVADAPPSAIADPADVPALLTADDLQLGPYSYERDTIDRPVGIDRSTDVLACAGALLRAGFADAQIAGVLLNPANAVSAHCLDQPQSRRAAERAISKAHRTVEGAERDRAEGEALAAGMGIGAAAADAPLTFEDVADWSGLAVPERRWMLDGWLPIGEAALLTGAGAVGKSLLAQQLTACVAAGRTMLGVGVEASTAIYITCEDPREELIRRQAAIALHLGISLADLRGRMMVRSWRGQLDNELVTFDRDRRMIVTARYRALRAAVLALRARFVVLDNTSHLFGGDENVKREVAAFCNLLNGLADDIDGVVLLLGHPNKGGLIDGAGRGTQFGGSVAWENQLRSRLFLAAPDVDDPDLRELTNPKANYSPRGGKLRFRWHQGAFARPTDLPGDSGAQIAAAIRDSADEAAFLACLDERNGQRRTVSEMKASRTYAPKEFAEMAEAKGASRERLEAAMDRLFRKRWIERGFVWRDASEGKDRDGLRRVSADQATASADLTADVPPTCSADLRPRSADVPPTSAVTHPSPKGEDCAAFKAAAHPLDPERSKASPKRRQALGATRKKKVA